MNWIILPLLIGLNIQIEENNKITYESVKEETFYMKNIKVYDIIGEELLDTENVKERGKNIPLLSKTTYCTFTYNSNGDGPIETAYYHGTCGALVEKIKKVTGCSN